MQKHQEALSNAIALVTPHPQTTPLPQNIGRAASATANSLIDAKLDFDNSRGRTFKARTSYRQHLTGKDDVSPV